LTARDFNNAAAIRTTTRRHLLRKNLVALSLLGAVCASASAQSTVTVFGILDVGVQYLKNGDLSRKLESIDGLQTSRLGFRDVEDLGGGLSAGFHIEGALAPDDGNAGGFNWRRRSTISLISSSLGELRLGRDYTPSFWNLSVFSPFGTNGVGSVGNLVYGFGGKSSTAPTIVRSDNSVGYFLPKGMGGVYGQAMVAAGEGAPTGKFFGARLGYASGPVDVAVALSDVTNNAAGDKFKSFNVGASYDLSVIKLMALYATSKQTTKKQNNLLLGATVPLAGGDLRASYIRADLADSDDDATQLAVGYVYPLSKRTALYSSYAHTSNKGNASFVIPGGAALLAGKSSTGIEAGIRHAF
jgi:predicted porin